MGGGPEGNVMTNQHRAVWCAGEQEDETAAATSLNSLLAPRSEPPIKSHPLSRDSFDFFTPVSGTLWNVTTRNRLGSRVGRVNARAPRRPQEGAQGQGLGKAGAGPASLFRTTPSRDKLRAQSLFTFPFLPTY